MNTDKTKTNASEMKEEPPKPARPSPSRPVPVAPVRTVPKVIKTEEENERALAIVESLMEKGERSMTPEEDALLDLLTNLIRDYEATAYPRRERSSPHEMVAFLLEQRSLAPKDLWPVIGSKSRVSEILAGRRSISKEQASWRSSSTFGPICLFEPRRGTQ